MGCVIVLQWIYILLHEFGHWLMAKLCGYQTVAFEVGDGKLWWRRETASSLWEFRLWPISGYIIALKLNGPETKAQRFLLSFGGPLFSGLCTAASYFAYRWLHQISQGGAALDLMLAQVMAITCVLSGISLIYNVWPTPGKGGNPSNDGWQMWDTLRSKTFPKLSSYEQLLQPDPSEAPANPETTFSAEAKALHVDYFRALIAERTKDLLTIIQQVLALPNLTRRERLIWQLQLLQSALHQPKDTVLLQAAADSCAAELQQEGPSEILSAMMGAVQIELGYHLEGRTLLYQLERHAKSDTWKAFAMAYLAISDFRQGWKPQASERLRLAHQLCPGSAAVGRADQEIHGGFYERLG